MKYKVKIKRDDKFVIYDVDLDENFSVLDVVEYIKNHIDPTLTYRAFCKSAICGSCAMVINGSSKLACKINAYQNVIDGVLEIEPLKNFEVIKDLVVNQDKGFNKLKQAKAYMIPKQSPKEEFLIPPKEVQSYDKQTDCILCMACFSDCPAVESDKQYFGPFVFSKLLRFENDSRDTQDRIKSSVDGNIFSCVECQACIIACPKGLAPQFDIKNLQSKATAMGYTNPNMMNFGSFDFGGFNPNF